VFNRTHWCTRNSLELDTVVSGSKIGLATGYGTRSLFFLSGLQISSGNISLLIDNLFLSNPLPSIIYQSSFSSTSRSIQIHNCYDLNYELEIVEFLSKSWIQKVIYSILIYFKTILISFREKKVIMKKARSSGREVYCSHFLN
jgi:hypothetical protein